MRFRGICNEKNPQLALSTRESYRTGGPAGVVLDIADLFGHLDQVRSWMVVLG